MMAVEEEFEKEFQTPMRVGGVMLEVVVLIQGPGPS
jgi:hypothetical protein